MRHPFFYTRARLQVRRALRQDGYGMWLVADAMDACEDDVVDLAVAEADAKCEGRLTAELTVARGLGDGKILEWLKAFFESELGKLLIEMLKALLLSLIVV